MAGTKFLTPLLKILICLAGMAAMGYFLLDALTQGELYESINTLRGLVFAGFGYLLARTIKQMLEARSEKHC